jgi:hypothetical protein
MHILVQTDHKDQVTTIKIRECGKSTVSQEWNGDLTITVPGQPGTVVLDDVTHRRHDHTREALPETRGILT